MRSILPFVCFFAVASPITATLSLAAAQETAKRVALVISNSSYEHSAKLKNPRNDAARIAEVLRKLGFNTIDGRDLDKIQLEDTIQKFGSRLKTAQDAVFYFAGHALQVNGRNYLVPVDARLSTAVAAESELTNLETIQRAMGSVSRANIIILDACRNNPFAANLSRGLGAEIGRGLAPVSPGANSLIAFSTQPNNTASDGTGGNSPYTAALLKYIRVKDLDISALLIEVRKEVIRNTDGQQVPWEHSSLLQPFYFTDPEVQSKSDDLSAAGPESMAADQKNAHASDAGSRPSTNNETHGDKSPIVSNANRDVIINYGE